MQILALEQTWERQNELSTGHESELSTERQIELSAARQNELSPERQIELSAARQNVLSVARQKKLPAINAIDGIDITTWQRNHEGLLIPPNEAYKLEALRACHDSGIAGHWGRHRTQELVSRNFWMDKWQEDIASYVAGCQRCQLA